MKYKSSVLVLLATVLVMKGIPCWAVPDGAGNLTSTPAPDISADTAMSARLNYNLGMEQFEKTQAQEKAAAALQGAKAKAELQKVLQGYGAARMRFEAAVKADPNLKEGWNLVGYTSRRLGEYEKSLQAYEKALALNPVYPEAIEYRAEAYLALNRLEDVKTAYMTLFGMSPSHATILMQSMQVWVTEQRKARGKISAEDLAGFAAWVEERASVAKQTTAMRTDVGAVRAWN